jgi:hypothetical protein
MPNQHWLLQWLDSYAVTSPRQADELLKKPHALSSLREEVEAIWREEVEATRYYAPMTVDQTGHSIVAGSEIDLSGELGCSNWKCMIRQVDKLFSSVWHYFDRIIVAGPSVHFYNGLWESGAPEENIIESLAGHIRVLLHVRNIGAEDIVDFIEKPRAWCAECFTRLVGALGVNSIEDFDPYVNDLIDRFDREADIEVGVHKQTGEIGWYKVYHPKFFEEPFGFVHDGPSPPKIPEITSRWLAERVVRVHVEALLCDLAQTQDMKAPLGTTLSFYKQILHEEAGLDEASVAFQMDLPILQGVDPEVLLKIRQDEGDHFDAFRNSLRMAIKERLRESDATDPKEIAEEIRHDLIDPALNSIERRLNAARSALLRKGAVSVGVGALATTCGLLTANPLLIGSGFATAMTTVAHVNKYIEEDRDVSLSDMYFLWRAQKHAKELA